MQFAYHSTGGATTQVNDFLVQNKPSIRYLSLHNPNWSFPTESISIRNLTNLDFQGIFPSDSRAFAEILSSGHQLESLRLEENALISQFMSPMIRILTELTPTIGLDTFVSIHARAT